MKVLFIILTLCGFCSLSYAEESTEKPPEIYNGDRTPTLPATEMTGTTPRIKDPNCNCDKEINGNRVLTEDRDANIIKASTAVTPGAAIKGLSPGKTQQQ